MNLTTALLALATTTAIVAYAMRFRILEALLRLIDTLTGGHLQSKAPDPSTTVPAFRLTPGSYRRAEGQGALETPVASEPVALTGEAAGK